jgi:hypothetical protein
MPENAFERPCRHHHFAARMQQKTANGEAHTGPESDVPFIRAGAR